MTAQASVRIEHVSKTYKTGRDTVVALQDVSLEIGEHDFVCIVGPSGCGKTTLLSLLAGFERPDAGTVEAFGRRVEAPGPDRTMMFQDYALFPWLTVRRNIGYGLRRLRVPRARREAIVERYVDLIGLRGFEHKYPRQLSGGMCQRVALARAMAVDPRMLLMDEPFAALDSFAREKMQDELVRVWSTEKKAVLFITHSIDEAVKLADVVAVMRARPGRILETFRLDTPRPRIMDAPEQVATIRRIRDILHRGAVVGAPAMQPGADSAFDSTLQPRRRA